MTTKKHIIIGGSLLILFVSVFAFAVSTWALNYTKNANAEKNEKLSGCRAKSATVSFFGWGGSEKINQWLEGPFAEGLLREEGFKLNRVGMNIDEILTRLLNEKKLQNSDPAKAQKGTMDVIWINGENFESTKKNGLLYGPFTDTLRNYNENIDENGADANYDFGVPIEGFEAPYGKAQFVFIYNSKNIGKWINASNTGQPEQGETLVAPKNLEELKAFIKANPGRFTYPAPPDFTGSAFLRTVLLNLVDGDALRNLKPDEDVVRAAIRPAMDYLKEIKPYLWRKGETYPADVALLDNMFADGEILMSMSYEPNHASGKIASGEYKDDVRTFLLDKGTVGNTHYLAIPFNAPNPEGAKAFINYMLSVEAQKSKYNSENWGDLPALSYNCLTEDEKRSLDEIKPGIATLSPEELEAKRLGELPAALVPIIEKIWLEEIPGK